MSLAEIRKRAMYDPQSLSESEWQQIHKAAFSVPKKEFYNKDIKPPAPLISRRRKDGGEELWKMKQQ